MPKVGLHQLAQSGATTGQAPLWNGTEYAPGDVNGSTAGSSVDNHTDANRPLGPFTKLGVVIARGASGDWDAALVESACPGFDPESQRYFLIYTGYAGTTASPTDAQLGIAWSLIPEGPYIKESGAILGGSGVSGDPDESGVTGATAWRHDDGSWTVLSIGLNAGGYEGGAPTLCRYTTPSLVSGSRSFTRHGVAVDIGGTGWRQSKVWMGSVVKVGNTFHMFLNGTAADGKERIGHASASDIDGTWTVDTSPVLDVGGSGAWDSQNVGQPMVFKIGETWYMEYYGVDTAFTVASDGIATTTEADFPTGWTKHPSNPFLTPGPGAYDAKFAHKPFSLVFPDRILHFYTCVASDDTRQVALATIGREVDGGGSTGIIVDDDGTPAGTGITELDFVGSTVEATVAGTKATITVTSSGSSGPVVPVTTLDSSGNLVFVTTDDGSLVTVEV